MNIHVPRWVDGLVLAFGLFLGAFLGFTAATALSERALDGGVATLVGSALGAAFTVAGSLWVARYQATLPDKKYAALMAGAIESIRRSCSDLDAVLAKEVGTGAEALQAYATDIEGRATALFDVIETWRNLGPISEVASFDARRALYRIDAALNEQVPTIRKELAWVQRPTLAVLTNTRGDLAECTTRILEVLEATADVLRPRKYV